MHRARKILGQAIGICPKGSLFKGYINLELQLGEVDRCRSLYAKFLEYTPSNSQVWLDFAKMEVNLGELGRARALYALASSQPTLDMPEVLWRSYIDFEIAEKQTEQVRHLYKTLLGRTSHVKVWIAYANFEAFNSEGGNIEAARKICRECYELLKSQGLKEERLALLEAWRDIEAEATTRGGVGDIEAVERMLPRRIKMRRMATDADGTEVGWEEFYDYNFPDDERQMKGMKILENALKWKKMANSEDNVSGTRNGGNDNCDTAPALGKRKASL